MAMAFISKISKKLSGASKEDDADEQEETKQSMSIVRHNDVQDMDLTRGKASRAGFDNRNENSRPIQNSNSTQEERANAKRLKEFRELVEELPSCDLDKLRRLAWGGVPMGMRVVVWKILLEYLPLSLAKREATLQKKREEYGSIRQFHIDEAEKDYHSESEKKVFKIIESDVQRTQPNSPVFHTKRMHRMLVRLLTIWHIWHPASGYVQGMNDLVIPLVAVFLSEYVDIDFDTFEVPTGFEETVTEEKLKQLEADTYYSLCRVLDGIQDNYTNTQPGAQRSVEKINEIVGRIDPELIEHFESEEINMMQIVLRWLFCLLVREFPLKLGIRLFDTYISDDKGFTTLHVYVCAALVLKWAQKLKKMQFNEIMLFLQSLPTEAWDETDLQMILAEAHVYQSLIEGSSPISKVTLRTI